MRCWRPFCPRKISEFDFAVWFSSVDVTTQILWIVSGAMSWFVHQSHLTWGSVRRGERSISGFVTTQIVTKSRCNLGRGKEGHIARYFSWLSKHPGHTLNVLFPSCANAETFVADKKCFWKNQKYLMCLGQKFCVCNKCCAREKWANRETFVCEIIQGLTVGILAMWLAKHMLTIVGTRRWHENFRAFVLKHS